jgi:hypothetical protein
MKLILIGLLTSLLLLVGCTPVKPWQKGNLSKPHMLVEPDPLEARFYRHINDSREGSSGGYSVGGGGCGCG